MYVCVNKVWEVMAGVPYNLSDNVQVLQSYHLL